MICKCDCVELDLHFLTLILERSMVWTGDGDDDDAVISHTQNQIPQETVFVNLFVWHIVMDFISIMGL